MADNQEVNDLLKVMNFFLELICGAQFLVTRGVHGNMSTVQSTENPTGAS
jgi:hypothetical protein